MVNLRHSCPMARSKGAKTFVIRLYRSNSARGREKIDLYLKREKKVDNMNESSHENRNSRVSYRDRVGENHRDSKQKD